MGRRRVASERARQRAALLRAVTALSLEFRPESAAQPGIRHPMLAGCACEMRQFRCAGSSVSYTYPSQKKEGRQCAFVFDSDSEALVAKNGIIQLILNDRKGNKEVMLLKIPTIEGLSSTGKAMLYQKWLSIFRKAIDIATTTPTSKNRLAPRKTNRSPKPPKMVTKYGTYFPSKTGFDQAGQDEKPENVSTEQATPYRGYFVAGICVGAYVMSTTVALVAS